jgi:hypothetical protein
LTAQPAPQPSVPSTTLAPLAPTPAATIASSPAAYSQEALAPTSLAVPSEKVVSGFGTKVPLAVALRQILPSDYGFSVDRDVTLSTLVTWRGGKPWRDALKETLQSAGFDMREQGQMVRIVRAAGTSPTSVIPQPETVQPSAPAAFAEVQTPQPQATVAVSPSAGMSLSLAPSSEPMLVVPTASSPAPAPSSAPALIGGSDHFLKLPQEVASAAAPTPETIVAVSEAPVAVIENPAPAPVPVAVAETWTASRGDMLHKVLDAWARQANVEIHWVAEYDYPIQATLTVTGSFEDAVRNLLSGFKDAQPQPVASLHKNPTLGQMVLVVEAHGNNYSD